MHISIAVLENQPSALVANELQQAHCLLIFETTTNEVVGLFNEVNNTRPDIAFAKATIDRKCEAIICGEIEKEAFEPLAREMITRYNGQGLEVNEAIRLFDAGLLPLIRDYSGGTGCPSGDSDKEPESCNNVC